MQGYLLQVRQTHLLFICSTTALNGIWLFAIFPDFTIHYILLKEFPQRTPMSFPFQDVTPLPPWITVEEKTFSK